LHVLILFFLLINNIMNVFLFIERVDKNVMNIDRMLAKSRSYYSPLFTNPSIYVPFVWFLELVSKDVLERLLHAG
jgi:hypothetical protein